MSAELVLAEAALIAACEIRNRGDSSKATERMIDAAATKLIEELANTAVAISPQTGAFLHIWAKTKNDGNPTSKTFEALRIIVEAYVYWNNFCIDAYDILQGVKNDSRTADGNTGELPTEGSNSA